MTSTCIWDSEAPLVAGSSLAAEGIEFRIEVLAVGIENTVESTVEAEHNLTVEQVC